MFRTIKQLQGITVRGRDGELGTVTDCYFDDQEWAIRYIVVDSAAGLSAEPVLISPAAVDRPDWQGQALPVNLTRDQVRNAPGIGTDRPVSRQQEIDLSAYYGWPAYWPTLNPLAPTMPYSGPGMPPETLPDMAASDRAGDGSPVDGDPHLRSGREVVGYHIEARDGRVGKIDDFVLDDETWRIGYMVVETGGLLTSKKVVLAPSWVQRVAWEDSAVYIDLDRDSVENGSEFDPAAILDGD